MWSFSYCLTRATLIPKIFELKKKHKKLSTVYNSLSAVVLKIMFDEKYIIIDVKFASGINNINFGLYPYIDVC